MTDFDEMSDEDLMAFGGGAPGPAEFVAVEEPADEPVIEDEPVVEADEPDTLVPAEGDEAVAEDEAEADAADDDADLSDDELGDAPASKAAAEAKTEEKPADAAPADPVVEEPAGEGKAEEAAAAPVDYEAGYKQIMGTFKANGKDFTPSSPEEAVRLMQMGANFTKKMQTLAPNLKLMRMLENKGLLSEEKLSFLIDVDAKNPAAITKLIRDAKIDPLDLDTSDTAPAYQPGNHVPSDAEMAFHSTVETVRSTETGLETIRHVNKEWDRASKDALFREPAVLEIINTQRANGLYDVIAAEVDRQRTLGELTSVSFLDAYMAAGNKLHAEGRLTKTDDPVLNPAPAPTQGAAPVVAPAPVVSQPAPKPLDTRPARRQTATNGDKVRAVTAPRSHKQAAAAFDVFSMSDEELMAVTSLKV